MHLPKLSEPQNRVNDANPMLRLMLRHNELFRLPESSRAIEVLTGTAWVTFNSCDIFLAAGERLNLPSRRDPVLISAMGQPPLILEISGSTSPVEFIEDCAGWQARSPPDDRAAIACTNSNINF